MTPSLCPQCQQPSPEGGLCSRCLLGAFLELSCQPEDAPCVPGETFGAYELLEPMGRGGMGVVWRARQASPARLVALKMVRSTPGPEAAEMLARFHTEEAALAALDHPHIVPIIESGIAEGQLFYTMPLVGGGSLADVLNGSAAETAALRPALTTPGGAADLVLKAARAVQHAHSRGIIHRDLKPGNVLLDDAGAPHLIDFGVARLTESPAALTITGAVVGTPAYMAPEQAAGGSAAVTTAADVYGLGTILYELFTGRAPFTGSSPLELLRLVVDTEPVRPSALRPRLDRDLETICLKCMEKNPARRYASAAALADDLERWQRGEPVLARRTGGFVRLGKWARRHPARATVGVMALAAAGVFLFMRAAAERALRREHEATKAAEHTAQENRYVSDIRLAHRELLAGRAGAARTLLAALDRPALHGWEWRYLTRQAAGGPSRTLTLPGPARPLRALAFDAAHRTLSVFTSGPPCEIWQWNLDAPDTAARRVPGEFGQPYSPALSPDGAWLATGSEIQPLRFHSWPDGKVAAEFPLTTAEAVFSPQSTQVVIIGPDGTRLLNWPSQRALTDARSVPGTWNSAAWESSGSCFATTSPAGDVAVWNAVTLQQITAFRTASHPGSVALWPGGQRLAIFAHGWHIAMAHRTSDGHELYTLHGHTAPISALALAPDARRLATASQDHTVRLWDAESGEPIARLDGHAGPVNHLAWLDARTLATCSADGTVRVWSEEKSDARAPLAGFSLPVISGDSAWLAGIGPAGELTVNSAAEGKPRPVAAGTHWTLGFLPGGTQVLAVRRGDTDHQIILVTADAAAARVLTEVPLAGTENMSFDNTRGMEGPWRLTLSPDGTFLAGSFRVGSDPRGPSHDGSFAPVWDVKSGARRDMPIATGTPERLALSPDGRLAAVARRHGGVVLCALPSWNMLRTLDVPEATVLTGLAFSPDSSCLAVTGREGFLRLCSVNSDDPPLVLTGHTQEVLGANFSPDGRTLASGGQDSIRLWQVSSGRALMEFASPGFYPQFTPDGRALIAQTWEDATLRWVVE